MVHELIRALMQAMKMTLRHNNYVPDVHTYSHVACFTVSVDSLPVCILWCHPVPAAGFGKMAMDQLCFAPVLFSVLLPLFGATQGLGVQGSKEKLKKVA